MVSLRHRGKSNLPNQMFAVSVSRLLFVEAMEEYEAKINNAKDSKNAGCCLRWSGLVMY